MNSVSSVSSLISLLNGAISIPDFYRTPTKSDHEVRWEPTSQP